MSSRIQGQPEHCSKAPPLSPTKRIRTVGGASSWSRLGGACDQGCWPCLALTYASWTCASLLPCAFRAGSPLRAHPHISQSLATLPVPVLAARAFFQVELSAGVCSAHLNVCHQAEVGTNLGTLSKAGNSSAIGLPKALSCPFFLFLSPSIFFFVCVCG